MSAKTRFMQRFLGAVTLIAILVIFLPILFNKRQYNIAVPAIEQNNVIIPSQKEYNKVSVESWVLKVKIFAKEQEAINFNKLLLQKEYSSFIIKDKDSNFIVYVGPELKLENIEQLQRVINNKFKVNAAVLHYDPLTM